MPTPRRPEARFAQAKRDHFLASLLKSKRGKLWSALKKGGKDIVIVYGERPGPTKERARDSHRAG